MGIQEIANSIADRVPALRSYKDKGYQRQRDKILLEHISSQLNNCELALQSQIDKALEARDFDLSGAIEKQRKQLNTLSAQIRYAPGGQSSVFSEKQIEETELKQVYEMDLLLLDQVDALKAGLDTLSATEIEPGIIAIKQLLADRDKFLKEYK